MVSRTAGIKASEWVAAVALVPEHAGDTLSICLLHPCLHECKSVPHVTLHV